MRWEDVRAAHPGQWLVDEALDPHSENDQRICDRIAVIDVCPDGRASMKRYAQLRRQHPHREFGFVHTSLLELKIEERRWLGIRGLCATDLTATLTYRGMAVEIANVLVDTGAASTVINADLAADAGLYLGPTDQLRRLRGVGAHEHVFMRNVDRFAVDDHGLDGFDLEIGGSVTTSSSPNHTS